MKPLVIGLLILIIFPLEMIITICSVGLYILLLDGELLTSKLIDKL